MDLTSTFNNAAAGPSGEAGIVSDGPGPQSPNAGYASAQTSASEAHTNTTALFTSAVVDPVPIAVDEAQVDPVVTAEAELQLLEKGRPKPEPRNDNEPRQPLKKLAEKRAEYQREARINALKAYMDYRNRNEVHEVRNNQRHDFDLCM